LCAVRGFHADGFLGFKRNTDIPSSDLKTEAAIFSETFIITYNSLLVKDKWQAPVNVVMNLLVS
jgi:hypothetical protein